MDEQGNELPEKPSSSSDDSDSSDEENSGEEGDKKVVKVKKVKKVKKEKKEKKEKKVKVISEEHMAAFATFDKDGNGFISADEFKQVYSDMSEHEILEMIKLADSNNDGRINYKEFVAMQKA